MIPKDLELAQRLCEIYFTIAADAIGEDVVRHKRDRILDQTEARSNVEAEVSNDFCKWEWNIKEQNHKIGCGGYVGEGVNMMESVAKFCPYCGKRLSKNTH